MTTSSSETLRALFIELIARRDAAHIRREIESLEQQELGGFAATNETSGSVQVNKYTENYLRGMPSEDCQKKDGEIKTDPNLEYSFACLVGILQERLIPKHIPVVEMGGK